MGGSGDFWPRHKPTSLDNLGLHVATRKTRSAQLALAGRIRYDRFILGNNKQTLKLFRVHSLQSFQCDSGQIIFWEQTEHLIQNSSAQKGKKRKVQNAHHLYVLHRYATVDNPVNTKCAQRDPSEIPWGHLKVGKCPEVCSNSEWITASLYMTHLKKKNSR